MSLTLSKIKDIQRDFDLHHTVSGEPLYTPIDKNNLYKLEHLAVCLTGEIGEFCNILKKIVRGDRHLEHEKSNLSEELADCFIYLLKISNEFEIDLENEFIKKLEKNKNRFKKI